MKKRSFLGVFEELVLLTDSPETVYLGLDAFGLSIVGGFHPRAEDGVADGIETLLLLGPGGPEMWADRAAHG